MALDLPQLVAGELRILMHPLTEVAGADDPALALDRFVRSCGWSSADLIDPAPVLELVAGLQEAAAVLEGDLVPGSIEAAVARVEMIGGLVDSLRALGDELAPGALSGPALASFGADVVARLLLGWLETRRPLLELVRVTGLLELAEVEASDGGSLTRPAGFRPRLRPDLVGPLLSDPLGRLAATLAPDGWDEAEGAALTNFVLRSTLGSLARSLGGRWRMDPDLLRRPGEIATRGRQAVIELPLSAGPSGPAAAFRAEVELLSRADGGPAVRVQPRQGFSTHSELGAWSVDTSGSLLVGGAAPGTPLSVTVRPDGIDGPPGLAAAIELKAARTLDLVLGSGRTGLTLGDLELAVSAQADGGSPDAGFSLLAKRSSVGLDTADFGRIVSAILNFEASVEFDAGLEWSREAGLRLAGSASLEMPLSDGFDLGIIAFEDLRLAFTPDDPLVIVIAGDVTIVIGPVVLRFEGLGLRITIDLAGMDMTVAAEPPTRLEFTITSEAVNGGGFLDIDAENGRYAGGLALDIFGFGLSAIVIVDTELPGGAEGFALFGSIGLEFATPIPIGFGFTLLGVGGLLALHRTLDIDGLAADLRTGAADSILFPDDLEEDPDAVLAGLDTWFPIQDGSSVFGPVVQIGWGSPTIVTAQLGVVVALPDLIVALLGSVEVLLPNPEDPVLSLRMDVLGAVDIPAADGHRRGVAARLQPARHLRAERRHGLLPGAVGPAAVRALGRRLPRPVRPARRAAGVAARPAPHARGRRARRGRRGGADLLRRRHLEHAPVRRQVPARGERRGAAHDLQRRGLVLDQRAARLQAVQARRPRDSAGSRSRPATRSCSASTCRRGSRARSRGTPPAGRRSRSSGSTSTSAFEIGTQAGGEPREIHDVATDVVTALEAPGAWQTAESGDAWASGVVMTDERPEGLWVRPDQLVELRQSVAPLNRDDDRLRRVHPRTRADRGGRRHARSEARRGAGVAGRLVRAGAVRPARRRRAAVVTVIRADDGGRALRRRRGRDQHPISWASAPPVAGARGVDLPRPRAEAVGPRLARRGPRRPRARPAASPTSRLAVLATTYTVVRLTDGARADVVLGRAGTGSALAYAQACAVVAGQPVAERSRLRVAPSHAAGERVTA